jgi:hypothetical protein
MHYNKMPHRYAYALERLFFSVDFRTILVCVLRLDSVSAFQVAWKGLFSSDVVCCLYHVPIAVYTNYGMYLLRYASSRRARAENHRIM